MLTQEEALKILQRTPLNFRSYYKYSFSYEGRADAEGIEIYASFGGDGDDIYRMSFGPSLVIQNFSEVSFCEMSKGGEKIFEYTQPW